MYKFQILDYNMLHLPYHAISFNVEQEFVLYVKSITNCYQIAQVIMMFYKLLLTKLILGYKWIISKTDRLSTPVV